MLEIDRVKEVVNKINIKFLGKDFNIVVKEELKVRGFKVYNPKIYIQIYYIRECNNSNRIEKWKSRKYYLPNPILDEKSKKYYLPNPILDEKVTQICYEAFKQAIEYEMSESFTINGKHLIRREEK